jgi:translation initiation factor IF-3
LRNNYFSAGGGNRPIKGGKNKHRINGEVRAKEVRLIGPDGGMLGVMSSKDAYRRAEDYQLDLVEIAPQAKPPVCKIIDYGKFLYEIQKKEKAQKKNQQQQQMKEIRFKWRTDTHDFNFKVKHAKDFLESGNKVKGTIMFRGREITHKEIGRELLQKFIEELQDFGKIDSPLKFEGKNLSVIMAPEKKKK